MPKRGSCGSVLPGCRLSKQRPSINSLAVHGCTSHACRDAHLTTLVTPVCRHPLLLSRSPTSRDFVPWRFLDAGQLSVRSLLVAGVQKPAQQATSGTLPNRSKVRSYAVGDTWRFGTRLSACTEEN